MKAVSFDFGQTLAELDYDFLRARLTEKGERFEVESAQASAERAWQIYGSRKSDGHAQAWNAMMQTQLEGGGLTSAVAREMAAWLWTEQPRKNLWRRPISGMIEVVRELQSRGMPVAVISNSEGYLAELIEELGWRDAFNLVVDSGRVGIDKPDPRIFRYTCDELGVQPEELLHVGDSWEADVQGALGAGASAVWFDARFASRPLPARVYGADGPRTMREVLARVGLVS